MLRWSSARRSSTRALTTVPVIPRCSSATGTSKGSMTSELEREAAQTAAPRPSSAAATARRMSQRVKRRSLRILSSSSSRAHCLSMRLPCFSSTARAALWRSAPVATAFIAISIGSGLSTNEGSRGLRGLFPFGTSASASAISAHPHEQAQPTLT